jgi:hypothetical protein
VRKRTHRKLGGAFSIATAASRKGLLDLTHEITMFPATMMMMRYISAVFLLA